MDEKELEWRRRGTETLLAIGSIERQGARLAAEWFAELGLDGVTPAQANALLVLFEAREPVTAREVAERLALSTVTVGRFMHALEEAGWIERQRSEDDRRAILLHPTEKAYEALPRFIEVANHILDAALEGLSERETQAFFRIVRKVNANLVAAGLRGEPEA